MKYFPILLLFVAIHAWADDYYVAKYGSDEIGIGSPDQPWASIQKAADSVAPGSTIHVAPGAYTQPIVTQTSGTGDDGGRITFISDTPYGAQFATLKPFNGSTGVTTWTSSDLISRERILRLDSSC